MLSRNLQWGIERVGSWIFWAGVWGAQQQMNIVNRTVHCVTWLLYFGRLDETSKKRLLLLWTKAAMMLDWGSGTLDITTAGIVGMLLGIALCWCWQWLLTVGGYWLPHTVTPVDVTTVAWCCRQTKDVLHPAECPQRHGKHRSDSGQQVSSLLDIAQKVTAICLLKTDVPSCPVTLKAL